MPVQCVCWIECSIGMTNPLFAPLTRIEMRQIRSDVTGDCLPYMPSSTVHRPPPFMADYVRARPGLLHRHVIWPRYEMRICMSPASMISLYRSRFAPNACSEIPAIPFINARSRPAEFPWRKDASPSCCARESPERRLEAG